MTQPLVILGTGGNAYDVLDVVGALNRHGPAWRVVGFLDDARAPGDRHLGLEVLGPLSGAAGLGDCLFLNAIGSDRSYRHRPELLARLGLRRERFATLVHPLASVSAHARLGHGVCVGHGASVAGGVVIGDHGWLGPGCIVGHDSEIADHAMLAPAAVVSGFCRLGTACYIGAGALLRQRVRVGERALVGMGAVVLHDVAAAATVVGNPGRLLERAAKAAPGAGASSTNGSRKD
jgi:sugar O-acyltransferase (sialic acid O-acetyltransferase NeuD family)